MQIISRILKIKILALTLKNITNTYSKHIKHLKNTTIARSKGVSPTPPNLAFACPWARHIQNKNTQKPIKQSIPNTIHNHAFSFLMLYNQVMYYSTIIHLKLPACQCNTCYLYAILIRISVLIPPNLVLSIEIRLDSNPHGFTQCTWILGFN